MKKRKKSFLGFWMMMLLLVLLSSSVSAAPKISQKKASVAVGCTVKLKVTGTKNKVKWSSSNKKVATVSSKGVVTGKKAGTAVIKAKVKNKTLKCTVKVYKNASSYNLDKMTWGNTCYGNISYKVKSMSFDKNGKLTVQILFRNNSLRYDYTIYAFNLALYDQNSQAFISNRLSMEKPFLIRAGGSHALTLQVKKKDLISVVDLTKITQEYLYASINI